MQSDEIASFGVSRKLFNAILGVLGRNAKRQHVAVCRSPCRSPHRGGLLLVAVWVCPVGAGAQDPHVALRRKNRAPGFGSAWRAAAGSNAVAARFPSEGGSARCAPARAATLSVLRPSQTPASRNGEEEEVRGGQAGREEEVSPSSTSARSGPRSRTRILAPPPRARQHVVVRRSPRRSL